MTDPTPQTMVVTGTSRGLGRSIVDYYLERGWTVFGCARGASDLEHERYTHTQLDVGDERAVAAMFGLVRRAEKPLYAVLNNAGMASMNHMLTTPGSTIEKLFRVNVLGTVLCSREAAKLMVPRKQGRIVNFGSVGVPYALEGEAAYVASKAAVQAYTKTIANELGDYGVTANNVSPNPIKTDLIAGVPEEKMQRLVNRQAIKRYGTVEDVLAAVDFLLAPESSFITGQTIYLGGP